MLKLKHLQPIDICLFAVLGELGSLTAAAARLDMPYSSAFRSLRKLEAWAGRQLLDRSTKPLKLSTEGINFLPSARQMLVSQDEIAAELRLWKYATRGSRGV